MKKQILGALAVSALVLSGLAAGTAQAAPPAAPKPASVAVAGDKVVTPTGDIVNVLPKPAGVKVDNAQAKTAAKSSGKAYKGMPSTSSGGMSTLASCNGVTGNACFLYNGGRQSGSTMSASHKKGIAGTIKIGGHQGAMAGADSYHDLMEVAVQRAASNPNNQNTIEIGVTVDPIVNKNGTVGTYKPRAFVFSWINGVGQGYNGGGFVPVTGTSTQVKVGQTDLTAAANYVYGVWHDDVQNAWWIQFGPVGDVQWIGFYPDTMWDNAGETFEDQDYVQLFGEIASAYTTPCSDMGLGLIASNTGAARFFGTSFLSSTFGSTNTTSVNLGTFRSPAVTAEAPYSNTYSEGPAGNQRSFRLGGPMHLGTGGSANGNPPAVGVIGNPC
ncbi:MAG: hypothetical protein ABW022_25675 [Actinoplanes sp.]